jgi:hypothetical protein
MVTQSFSFSIATQVVFMSLNASAKREGDIERQRRSYGITNTSTRDNLRCAGVPPRKVSSGLRVVNRC